MNSSSETPSSRFRWEMRAGVVLGVMVVILVLIWARVLYSSLEAYKTGERFLKENQTIRAITYFDRSLHWYAPFNPYVEKSAVRLWEIAEQAERQGDTKLALIALRTIRGGFYAARHFVTPGKGWIERSEVRIDHLVMLEEKKKSGGEGSGSPEKRVPADQIARSPDVFWVVTLEIGLLGWIGSALGFLAFGLRKREKPGTSIFTRFALAGLAGIFFLLWIVGMVKA